MKKRVQHLFSTIIVAGFLFIAFGSGDDDKTEEEVVKNGPINKIDSEDSNVNGSSSLKIIDSATDFKERFNDFMNEMNSDFSIGNIKISEGKVNDTFSVQLNSHIGLLIQFNKEDESVRSIMMIGMGDGTTKSGLNILITMGAIIASVDPNLTPSERGQILREIGVLGDDADITNMNGSTVRNEIKYFISSSSQTGIMFGAQSSKE